MNPRSPLASTRLLPLGVLIMAALGGCDRELPSALVPDGAVFTQSANGPVVNSLADDWDGTCTEESCTLRDAVEYAVEGAEITFSVTGIIALEYGTLIIDKDLTITGPGAASLTVAVQGTGDVAVFAVEAVTVSISGVTITGGTYSGVLNHQGTLTLDQVAVTGNSSSFYGGGIQNLFGTLVVTHSRVAENSTASHGGGIATVSGEVTLSNVTIAGNSASGEGGGVHNYDSTVRIENSTISGNAASGGGGVYSETNSDLVTGWTTILTSTVSGNTAAGDGGGVRNWNGLTRISHSTITGNVADGNGGGVVSYNDGQTRTDVRNSIIWGNTSDDVAADVPWSSGSNRYNSAGYNLIGAAGADVDFAQEFDQTGDLTDVADASLGALLLHSPGTTRTHALLTGSLAIDAGTCTDIEGVTVTTDQRGVFRPQGLACDIGAYESEETSGLPAPDFSFDLSGLAAKTYGDASFSVADYASSTNSDGTKYFSVGTGSVGCSVTSAGVVTITGAATGTSHCILSAFLTSDGTYSSAGPLSQSFQIAKAALTVTANDVTITFGQSPSFSVGFSGFVGSDDAGKLGGTLVYSFEGTGGTSYGPSTTAPTGAGTYSVTPGGLSSANYSFTWVPGAFTIDKAAGSVSISNIPTDARAGDTFTPEYTKAGDGEASTTSLSTDVCTVDNGVVSFDDVGTCQLRASVTEGTNHQAATGSVQSFTIAPPFNHSCTFTIHPKNGQRQVTVNWGNANPGVTLVEVTDGRTASKKMAPTATGSWSVNVKGDPTYGLHGGEDRRDTSAVLVPAGTACIGPE
jgi:CSLREA domain-containing protein